MSADVVTLPGVERRDLGADVSPEAVLRGALEDGVHDVIIVAKTRDGERFLASCDSNVDAVVGKLFSAAQYLASSRYDLLPDESGDAG